MSAYDLAQKNQRLAADPEANVFVTANAGSGKTKVLIDRIARLLLAGAPPASFLCITYTKAAAAEMQRRLFERLGTWCVADDAALRKALEELAGPEARIADDMLPRARALFAQALETPGGLKIQTIHAFCERLLGRFPLEAGAPPGFEVADEPRAALLMRNARNRLCEGDDETVARAFARFAGRLDADRLDRLLAELAARNLSDAAHIQDRHGSQGDGAEIIAAAIAETPWRDLADAADRLMGSGSQDQDCAERIRIARSLTDEPADAWKAYLEVFFTQAGKPRAKIVSASFAKNEPGIDRLMDAEFGRVVSVREAFLAAERAADSAAAYAIAACLAAAYKDEKRRAGLLDFADLIVQARALLTQSDAAPWVLYKLDGGIDHILVDEGQDTSPDQWELIGPLRDEFFAGAGARSLVQRTMFAVGDPKQSIYSFQGADPRYFLAERQTLSSRAHAADRVFVAPNLGMSFRSTKEVLGTVDKVFDGKDLAGGAPEAFDIVKHDVSRANEGGVVEIWPFLKRPTVSETRPWDAPLDMESALTAPVLLAKHIARAVKGWIDEGQAVWDRGQLRPMRGGDVMALVRTRGPVFEALIRAFKREGLTVAGADRMVLRNELAAEDCLALMRVALDPRDDLALACVLKGPWLNLTNDDADLFPLAHGRVKGETLWDRLKASTDLWHRDARNFVTAMVERAGEDAFSFLSWALEQQDSEGRSGWARVLARLGPEARDPIEELLERALAPARGRAPTLQRFLADIEADAIEVKREMEEAGDAIRVMTVHAAKGLEAPVVILPDTTGPVKDAAENGVLLGEDGLYWSPSAKEDDRATAAVRAVHEARAEGEHLRLLYVAMTRARDRLIVCGYGRGAGQGTADARSWHAHVWNMLSLEGEEIETPTGKGFRVGMLQIAPSVLAAREAAKVELPAWVRRPLASAEPVQRAAPSRLKPADPAALSPRRNAQKRFQRGRWLHGLIQRLPEIDASRRGDAARAWLTRQGAPAEEVDALAAEAIAVIEAPAFAAAFGPGSRAEAPIAGEVLGRPVRGIVDRLVVSANEVLVLDFKSDRPAPVKPEDAPRSYVLQMALYRAVLAQIFAGRVVRCGLIWTEKPLLAELSLAQMEAALSAFGRS